MSRKLVATSAVFALAMLGFAGFASPAAALAGDTIVVTSTIQAAVDAALLHCANPWHAEAATSARDQIARASSSNATATRRFAGSSTASS